MFIVNFPMKMVDGPIRQLRKMPQVRKLMTPRRARVGIKSPYDFVVMLLRSDEEGGGQGGHEVFELRLGYGWQCSKETKCICIMLEF